VVAGTNIPCGEKNTPQPPFLTEVQELTTRFNNTMKAAGNGVGVGGTYLSGGGYMQRSVLDISLPEEIDSGVLTYLAAVEINFRAQDYLVDLKTRGENKVDLSRVPNVVRSVLVMPGLDGNTTHVNMCTQSQVVGVYARMVCVNLEHTMQNIQDAIAWREGLVFDAFALQIHARDVEEVLIAQTTVLEYLQMRHNSTIETRLLISWDGQLCSHEDSSDEDSSEDDNDSDDADEDVAVLTPAEVPTPNVYPVDYPSDDTRITPEETLDYSDAVASDSILSFYD
jgi:hypothetical protein